MSELGGEMWRVELGQGMGCLRLGETREEVVRALAAARIEHDWEEDEGTEAYLDALDTELKFKGGANPELREIEVWDERVRLGTRSVIGERLHTIVDFLQVPEGETLWRYEGEGMGSDGRQPLATDRSLLARGTLWIVPLGLGLTMMNGEICAVLVRRPEESPRRGLGTFSAEQRALSARGDLYLQLNPKPVSGGKPGRSWIQGLLSVAMVGTLGLTVWRAIEYQQRWNAAVVAPAEVVEVDPPPPHPFPERYTVTYQDQAGTARRVVLERRDVYVAPQVGEKVEVRYLPESPDQPLGPARWGDVAFEKYVPWGIGILAAFSAIQLVVALLAMVMPGGRGRRV